ncbi:MAG: MBL fold metallo-hydrolase [Thomasclavelia sp.]|jgi:L-ascorbate metabolism protein UlaG (beta-lactamase superfamily)|nr:MBL fold metallo-hydrolase [Thomasclavelia sp.]
MNYKINDKGQAQPLKTVKMGKDDFKDHNNTSIYWLGGGGAMINTHGTIIMIDPLLEGFDMPLLIDMPLDIKDVVKVDGVLVSHVDNDHYSRPTLRDIKDVTKEFHTSFYVASLMKEECGINNAIGHDIGDKIKVNDVEIITTPADHAWQNGIEKYNYRVWEDREYCGFYLTCKDCKIWYVGDSKLLDSQLHMDPPDVILFDYADNPVHIGLKDAYKLANTYPDSKLILIHWGSVDSPKSSAFNGNPKDILDNVINPERVLVLNPGEKYIVGDK